jgi:hypothetical protein
MGLRDFLNPGDGVMGSLLTLQLFFVARVIFLNPGDGVIGSFL